MIFLEAEVGSLVTIQIIGDGLVLVLVVWLLVNDLIDFCFFGNFVYLNIILLFSIDHDLKNPSFKAWVKLTDSKEGFSSHNSHRNICSSLNGATSDTSLLENFCSKNLTNSYLRKMDPLATDAIYLSLDNKIHVLCNFSEFYNKLVLRNDP